MTDTTLRGFVTPEQYDYLLNRLRSTRIASRTMPGSSRKMSYLESWDVRAHLIRMFGFGNFDIITEREAYLGRKDYVAKGDPEKNKPDRDMVEVSWHATVTLVVRDVHGGEICRFTEGAVGSATGGEGGAGFGDLHDNALKSAASDALKRCAINLGTQFGLSLYNNGQETDVVRMTLVQPEGWEPAKDQTPDEAQKVLEEKLGAQPVEPTGEGGNEGHLSDEDVAAGAGA